MPLKHSIVLNTVNCFDFWLNAVCLLASLDCCWMCTLLILYVLHGVMYYPNTLLLLMALSKVACCSLLCRQFARNAVKIWGWLLYWWKFRWCSCIRRRHRACQSLRVHLLYCILFNANKSKCMVTDAVCVQNCEFAVWVEGKPMEFVSLYSHLGHLST